MRRFLSFGPAFVVLLTAIVTLILIPGAIRGITAATTHANVTLAQQSLEQQLVRVVPRMPARVVRRRRHPSLGVALAPARLPLEARAVAGGAVLLVDDRSGRENLRIVGAQHDARRGAVAAR